jgi:hypothetical protein
VLVGVGRSVVSSPPFRAAVRRAARATHHAIFSGTGREIVLSVKDLGVLVQSLSESHPALANRIPPQMSAALARIDELPGGDRTVRLARLAVRLRASVFVLLALGIVLSAAGVWLSSGKRRAIVRVGAALAVLALVLGIFARFGGDLIGLFAQHSENTPALAALAGAFLGGLLPWAAGLGFAGLMLAAAAASLLDRVSLTRISGHVRLWMLGAQARMRLRLVRGIVASAIGASLLVWPIPTLTVVAWLCGLVIGFAGMREAFVAALHLLPEIEARVPGPSGHAPRRRAVALVSGVVVALIVPILWLLFRPTTISTDAQEVMACNGSVTLCDRPLDRVIFPASHNSMGGADVPGWMFPNQNDDIQKQLADGIRAFLIDVHYGEPAGERVVTDLTNEASAMAKYESAVGKEGMEAALRIRDRLAGEKHGERDVYMCHGFCELGALKFVPVLRDVRDFLVANPGEVLIFVIQDEGVTPADVERCFRESGLIEFVYHGPVTPPWPTLRQMVESDQRVLVMAENHSEGVAWYHPAFEVLQETPYSFENPSEFSNKPNRGGTSGSLYLLNHWIETTPMPKPSNAALVNSRNALLKRIGDFRRLRGHDPNLVAVDFYGTGDLIQVVRELNSRPLPRP